MSNQTLEIRAQMAIIARRLFERKLLDMAGGNISARIGELMVISPRYSGSKKNWQLNPEDFVEGSIADKGILNELNISRESKMHHAVYEAFPGITGIIHAHPFNILPFAAASKPIPPVLEDTQKFGTVPVVSFAPAHSSELAVNVVEGLRTQREKMAIQAAAVILPLHGILVAAKDIFAAIDALERIDWNAWCLIAMNILK